MSYEVSTPVFEGPFDLLLHLITSEEVDVYEVSLSRIVDAYLVQVEAMAGSLNLEVATEFALIAATLIQLKCRRLLPVPEGVDLDEELEMWEARDLLLSRLLEFSAFRDVAADFRARMAQAALSLPRTAGMEERFLGVAPDMLEGVRATRLRDAMNRILTPRPVPQLSLSHVTPVKISVGETIKVLAARLVDIGEASFRELTSHMTERIEIVVAFLAVLELYKQDLVDLEQATQFGELRVTWKDVLSGDDEIDALQVSAELSDIAIDKAMAVASEEYEG